MQQGMRDLLIECVCMPPSLSGPHGLFTILNLSCIYWKTVDRRRDGDVWTLEFECLPGSLTDQREAAAAVLAIFI